MAAGTNEEDWVADKRDFVADSRDDVADGRSSEADAREQAANAREAELEAWERRLETRAAELGLPDKAPTPAAGPAESLAGRRLARADRTILGHDRQSATVDRNKAAKLRLADASPAPLALAFAEIAGELYDSETFDDVLQRIAEVAVATVAGCDVASITILEHGEYRTAASTGASAVAVDAAQYEANEGPGLDALNVPLVYAESFPDDRWPALGAHPTESGVESAVSYQLGLDRSSTADGGSLNTYGTSPESFDAAAQEIGFILAAHATIAAKAVGERATLEGFGQHLQDALLSRDVIGQAKGILMERLRLTPEDAFDVLRHSSQQLNVKLREVASRLVETGEVAAQKGDGSLFPPTPKAGGKREPSPYPPP